MEIKRKIVYIIIMLIAFIILGKVESKAGELELNNLDFNIQINQDGSMDVTETWNIFIRDTNTLYKSFKTDNSKYASIINVQVKDITSGTETNFIKTDKWAYHVKRNHYYGTNNANGDFEIGWGVGLDNEDATRKYKISYTVKDAITKYNDYSELYWQFIGKDFEVDARRITGTIYLPSNVNSKEEIKVWGHTEGLNGTIYATDLNKIEFEIYGFRSGRFVEVRTLFPSQLIKNTGRIKNDNILQNAINEETKWAQEANEKRETKARNAKLVLYTIVGFIILANIILIIVYIKKAIKYKNKNKQLKKYKPTVKLDYFRDLPYETATPGEAVKTLDINISEFTPINFGQVFSATILNLTLKKYLDIQQIQEGKKNNNIIINILKDDDDQLKEDERCIIKFIKESAKGNNTITLKQLERYIESHTSKIEQLLKSTNTKVNEQLIQDGIINKKEQEEYIEYKGKQIGYIVAAIFLITFTLILFIIPGIIFIINAVLCSKIANKINVLTQKGLDFKEQWKGLKKYMEDFSMLDKREVPELVIWEKYLVYATAFGIADKVIKQLKIVYPNFEEITSSNLATYAYMNLIINTNFSKSFTNSINTSISMAYSSGTGGGGGFSAGGGFGRRPEVAEAVDRL